MQFNNEHTSNGSMTQLQSTMKQAHCPHWYSATVRKQKITKHTDIGRPEQPQ